MLILERTISYNFNSQTYSLGRVLLLLESSAYFLHFHEFKFIILALCYYSAWPLITEVLKKKK